MLGWDPDLMANLGSGLQSLFPALLSHRAGISLQLSRLIRQGIGDGLGAAAVQRLYEDSQTHYYDRIRDSYLSTLVEILLSDCTSEGERQLFLEEGFANQARLAEKRGLQPLGDFRNSSGYAGRSISESYILKWYQRLADRQRGPNSVHRSSAHQFNMGRRRVFQGQ